MKVTPVDTSVKNTKCDAVAVFLPEEKAEFQNVLRDLRPYFGRKADQITASAHFTGKSGEILTIHTDRKIAAPLLFLAGAGSQKMNRAEAFRRAAAAAVTEAKKNRAETLALVVPDGTDTMPQTDIAYALTEGAILGNYRYVRYLSKQNAGNTTIRELRLCVSARTDEKAVKQSVRRAVIVCESTCFARDLENAPPNELYPETLADAAKESAGRYGYTATVWDKKKIGQAGFGGLLAVNAGSDRPARFIVLEHAGADPKAKPVVLVGKGVTFDAGGISIKPAAGMAEMKMDMSGAAAVLATLEASARLRLPHRVIGLIPATENLLGGSAMRPGDIIRHYGGITSEIDNTDAEGRLILADALAYASTLSPSVVIDLATLTGACVVALGHHATGMMGTDREVMDTLKSAGETTFERVWELPLYEEYEKQIKSDVADVRNVGGRWAGAITAALFLKRFTGDYRWVHLDIAGTAILEEALPYAPKGGSGVGVRLLTEFLKRWQ
ncbi:MAG TPA: leucyl aminopeptidase [Bacteroidota bacterium]|nr:leucyl aminopeptidase [Bacteroidota bacterium]